MAPTRKQLIYDDNDRTADALALALHDQRNGFAVTIRETVGWVDYHSDSEHNPAEAALLIIARAQRDGMYEFPGPDENTTTRIHVQWTAPGA